MSREIMQQALQHLVDLADDLRRIPSDIAQTIEALEAELAKPEQEPVCDKDPSLCGFVLCQLGKVCKHTPINTMPTKIFAPNLEQILNAAGFYRREWVGLTDDEIWECQKPGLSDDVYKLIEAKLKERNT